MGGARFISVNAGNHLVARLPAWDDSRRRLEDDLVLIWPLGTRPSVLSEREFRVRRGPGFRFIPYTNVGFSWDECLLLTPEDWKIYRNAVADALHLVRTRKWVSNIRLT